MGAVERVRVDGLGRVDRRVVGRLLLAAGRLQLALEQAGCGRELGDPDQRGDELAERQRRRVDRVVGPRVGDEPVHVEVLGDPHRPRRRDPEPARGVGREGGRVVGRRRLAGVPPLRQLGDDAGRVGRRERGLGLGLLPELVGLVVRLEGALGVGELREHLPERLRHVGSALELALDDQAEGRALDAADGEEVGAEPAGRQRDGPGQRRPPDQVDLAAGLSGVGERVGELVELVEGPLDLVLGQRRVAGPLDGPLEAGVHREDLAQRLEADQLALAVEVGRDHDGRGFLGELLDGLDDVLVGRLGHQLGVDQRLRVGLLPVRVALREGRVEHVALEADRHLGVVARSPGVIGDLVGGVGLRLTLAEDLGDLLGAVVLLGDDQPHGDILCRFGAPDEGASGGDGSTRPSPVRRIATPGATRPA